MAGFRTHITTSSVLGVGYSAAAFGLYEVPWPTALVGGAVCGLSGMLPDLDSGPGIPLRESVAFAAACVPMLMIDHFRHLGMTPEMIALAGAAMYLGIRFGVGTLLKNYTVHRGMFHSIPALLIAGLGAFLICASGPPSLRLFKAGGVILGFASHLILDEIYSVDLRGVRLKKSFGTAIKFVGDTPWANFSAYAKLAVLAVLFFKDPVWIKDLPERDRNASQIASNIWDAFREIPATIAHPNWQGVESLLKGPTESPRTANPRRGSKIRASLPTLDGETPRGIERQPNDRDSGSRISRGGLRRSAASGRDSSSLRAMPDSNAAAISRGASDSRAGRSTSAGRTSGRGTSRLERPSLGAGADRDSGFMDDLVRQGLAPKVPGGSSTRSGTAAGIRVDSGRSPTSGGRPGFSGSGRRPQGTAAESRAAPQGAWQGRSGAGTLSMPRVEQDRDRPIIDERNAHHRPEATGFRPNRTRY